MNVSLTKALLFFGVIKNFANRNYTDRSVTMIKNKQSTSWKFFEEIFLAKASFGKTAETKDRVLGTIMDRHRLKTHWQINNVNVIKCLLNIFPIKDSGGMYGAWKAHIFIFFHGPCNMWRKSKHNKTSHIRKLWHVHCYLLRSRFFMMSITSENSCLKQCCFHFTLITIWVRFYFLSYIYVSSISIHYQSLFIQHNMLLIEMTIFFILLLNNHRKYNFSNVEM